jgi:hypothetical protein
MFERNLVGRGGLTKKADAPVPKEAAAEARPEKVAHDVPTHLKLLPLKLDKMPKESIREAAGEIDVVCRRRRRIPIPMIGAILGWLTFETGACRNTGGGGVAGIR